MRKHRGETGSDVGSGNQAFFIVLSLALYRSLCQHNAL